jgi:hypothetical protein
MVNFDLNVHTDFPVKERQYRVPSSEPIKMLLLPITAEDFVPLAIFETQATFGALEMATAVVPVRF